MEVIKKDCSLIWIWIIFINNLNMSRYSELNYLTSYENLKSIIYNLETRSTTPQVIQIAKHSSKSLTPLEDFSFDPNIVFAIQNDPKLINIITKCRKQKSPLMFVFIESNVYITFIIKNTNSYPLILIRIPINNHYTFANETTQVFEFPIINILDKVTKVNKNTPYSLVLRNKNNKFKLTYKYLQSELILKNIRVYNRTTLNEIFMTDTDLAMFESDNYLNDLYNSNILIINKPTNVIQLIDKHDSEFVLKLTEDGKLMKINDVSEINTNKEIISLRSESYLWDIYDTKARYFSFPVSDSLFKQDYLKGIITNDKIYFIFGIFFNYYSLIKVITPLDISETKQKTLMNIFNNDYQILEIYICKEITK
jgi:hypothetical protein